MWESANKLSYLQGPAYTQGRKRQEEGAGLERWEGSDGEAVSGQITNSPWGGVSKINIPSKQASVWSLK